MLLVAVLLPPIPAFMERNMGRDLIINALRRFAIELPGSVYVVWITTR